MENNTYFNLTVTIGALIVLLFNSFRLVEKADFKIHLFNLVAPIGIGVPTPHYARGSTYLNEGA